MLDLAHMYKDRVINKPADNFALQRVYSIDGISDLINQCYPNIVAFLDMNMDKSDTENPCIKLVLTDVGYPVPFIDANKRDFGGAWLVNFLSRQPVKNVHINGTKLENPVGIRLETPALADNVSLGVPALLYTTARIGNNCHFETVEARGVQSIGDNFSANTLIAPQLTSVGRGFNVKKLDAPALPHPANVQLFDARIRDQDAKIAAAMGEIERIKLKVAEMQNAREKLVAQRAICLQNTK